MANKEELRAGDVVIYKHTKLGEKSRNGSLGIVLDKLDSQGDHHIAWILPVGNVVPAPCAWNLEVIGHIDDPTIQEG